MLFRAAVLVALAVSAYGACPPVPAGACNVCGDGKCVSKPEAMFAFGRDKTMACGALQEAGFGNYLNPQFCGSFPALLEVCGCDELGPPDTPAPVESPTMAPSLVLTSAPAKPTKKPKTKKAGKKRALREAADTAHV